MIFPFLSGFFSPSKAPITYLFVALNLIVFAFTYETYLKADQELTDLLKDDDFLQTQGAVFSQMILGSREGYSSNLVRMAETTRKEVLSQEKDVSVMLGYVAMRHPEFITKAQSTPVAGDEIALKSWKTQFARVMEIQAGHPLYFLGLSFRNSDWQRYLTYQFTHSGFVHLLWNLLFLLLFGALIEVRLGYHWLITAYVGGGLMGALAYEGLSGVSGAPLVGASGSVSAIMALTAAALWRERSVFWYWFLPFPGYYGFMRMPTWIILILFVVPDLAGAMGAVNEIGFSVAHTAHLGGSIFGLTLGALYLKSNQPHEKISAA